jgi:hypothetical protein
MSHKLGKNYNILSPYKLDRKKVKILLAQKDMRSVDIARQHNIPSIPLSLNISGKGRNLSIQQAVADALGVPLDSIAIHAPWTGRTRKTSPRTGKRTQPQLPPVPRTFLEADEMNRKG